jgi:3-dehydroquinate synthase
VNADSHLTIVSSSGEYEVVVGSSGALTVACADAGAVVVDSRLTGLLPPTSAPVVEVEASEENKDLAACERLALALRDAGVRRGDLLVAVGGGVVQDVATFVASVYMRGLPWTYAPTTLMAMADSCIGGKSSINAGGVKNLLGNIYPPGRVVVDPVFLRTLAPAAISAGLAEAVKICFCRGEEAFRGYLDRYERFDADPTPLLVHTLASKQWFIEVDEHDRAERRLLNFGHTFGHALEVGVDYRTSHGAAVAVGMLCALNHPGSARTGTTEVLRGHCLELLSEVRDLGEALEGFDDVRFERAFRSDKKHTASSFTLILPAVSGGVQEVSVANDDVSWTEIANAVSVTLSGLKGVA